jgi:hypothetical protein
MAASFVTAIRSSRSSVPNSACVGLGIGGGWAVQHLIMPAEGALGVDTAALAVSETGAMTLEAAPGGVFPLGLWDPTSATWLVLIGVLVGLLLYLGSRAMKIRVVPTFAGGEDSASDAQWHVSGTHFYETIRRLPVLRGLFADASAGAFDAYRLTGTFGHTLVERLRSWHTGVLAVYASWILVGLAVLVMVLTLG